MSISVPIPRGHFIPEEGVATGDVRLEADRIAFGVGVIFETELIGALPLNADLPGLQELRKITRRTGNVRDMCGGMTPNEAMITVTPNLMSLILVRKTLTGAQVCGNWQYRRS